MLLCLYRMFVCVDADTVRLCILLSFVFPKLIGPMVIAYRYSLSNVDIQLVMFRCANNLGFLVMQCSLEIRMGITLVTLIRVDLHLVLFLCWQVLRSLAQSCTGYCRSV